MPYQPDAKDYAMMDKLISQDKANASQPHTPYVPDELDRRMLDKSVVGVPGSGVTYATPERMRQDVSGETEDRTTKDLKDFLPGLANPWVNALNLLPNVNIKHFQQENPHSMVSYAGKLTGTIAPFMTGEGAIAGLAGQIPKAARGLELGEKAIKGAESAMEAFTHPSPLRSAIAGGLTGYGTSANNRKINAALGALSAGTLHGAGDIVGGIANKLPIRAKIQKAASLYEPTLSENPADAARKVSEKIADNYIWDKRYGNKLYKAATTKADQQGIKFKKGDFPSYSEKYNELLNDNMLPEKGVKHPNNLIPSDNSEGISPTSVHKMKSDLLKMGRMAGSGFDKKSYNDLSKSLLRDYYKKTDEFDPHLSHNYEKANEYWKNNIINTYRNHGAFKKMRNVLEEIPGGLENEDKNLYRLNWHGKSPSDLVNNLVPRKASDGMALLESFKNDLMKGDHEGTKLLAKDLMFSKHATPLNGPPTSSEIETPHYKFNIHNFLTHYGKLGEDQKAFLFDPEERKTLDVFHQYKDKLKEDSAVSKLIKKGLGASMGYIIGSHTLGSPIGKALSVPIGAALAEPAEQGAISLTKGLLPSNTKDILETIKPYQSSFKKTRLPASTSVGAIQTILGSNNANQ